MKTTMYDAGKKILWHAVRKTESRKPELEAGKDVKAVIESDVVMRTDWLETLKRVVGTVLALVVAIGLIIRGNVYGDVAPSMVGPTMCIVSGLLLLCTTVAMNLRSREAY